MSEKQQRTAASVRDKMVNRYGDNLAHKHNKSHNAYRQHYRTHPVIHQEISEQEKENEPTGLLRAFKLKKIRKRKDKGGFH